MKKTKIFLYGIILTTMISIAVPVYGNTANFTNKTLSEDRGTTLATSVYKDDVGSTTITKFEAETTSRVIIYYSLYNSNTNKLIYSFSHWSNVPSTSIKTGTIQYQSYTLKGSLLDYAGSFRVSGVFKP